MPRQHRNLICCVLVLNTEFTSESLGSSTRRDKIRMASLHRILSLSSHLCLQSRLYHTWGQTVQLIAVYKHLTLTPRSFSTFPNILRKKCKKFNLCRDKSSPVAMPISLSALGLVHQARLVTTTAQEMEMTSGGQTENKKEEKDKWYSGTVHFTFLVLTVN